MKSGVFMDIISVHYKDIVSLFKSRRHIVEFDEDLFGDAFIKCALKFGNSIIDYDTAIKYFWVVYVNNVKLNFTNSLKYESIKIDYVDENDEDVIYEIDYSDTNKVDEILEIISEKFGEDDTQMYRLYKYYNWSEQELNSIGILLDKNKIKEIHKYVKTYYKDKRSN